MKYYTGVIWTAADEAVDTLVEKYGDTLTLYINGYLKDIHEAEDLMIDSSYVKI